MKKQLGSAVVLLRWGAGINSMRKESEMNTANVVRSVKVIALMLVGVLLAAYAQAADLYYDTTNSAGLQGGAGVFTNAIWASDTGGAGQGTLTVASNDNVFIQAASSKTSTLTWQGSGTNYINNWTVDNGNVVTNSPITKYPLNLWGTLTVQGNSYMYWGAGNSFAFLTRLSLFAG